MVQVHLHAGMPRAGSSALQDFCRLNVDLLSKSGVAYPQLPRLCSKKFAAAACNGADFSYYICNDPGLLRRGREGLAPVIETLRTVQASHVIVSSEFFFGAPADRLATVRDAFKDAGLPCGFTFTFVNPMSGWSRATRST